MRIMKKKKTAVVGAGWFGRAHIRNFSDLSKLQAVCDADTSKLDFIQEQYDTVNTYRNIDDLLNNEDIDAVSIVIPPRYIPEITKKCIDQGIDVLMEKPMSLNLEKLKQFKDYEESVRIMPGFIELFNPVFNKLMNNLSRIGNIISIASKRIGLYPKREWNMGVILDLSIHDIYLQERILGKENLKKVKGFKKSISGHDHTDAAFIILDFGNAIGHIESNWLTPSKFRKMYINGVEGGIVIDFISQKINIRTGLDLDDEWPKTKEEIITPLRSDEPLKREIMNFLYDDKPEVSLDDGIRALEIALKIVNK
ncbi:MAG: Oxidoreductase [Promethearchaeota archaeon]|nr:MAG: Oxidoreductase [Candidatus Lokiarchaeota archaeon]